VVGDPLRLRQVILNLGGNAIKFTERGEVVIDVGQAAVDNGKLTIHCRVQDTGIGISPEKQAHVFQPFSQADESTTRRFGGTGLGLTISSQLVELMRGRIWLESQLGRGTTIHFTATFKVAKQQPQLWPARCNEGLKRLPVLVVDDNHTNRRVLEEMLSNWGLRPVTADGGAAALDALQQAAGSGQPFQLVLLDLMMPVMDGFELAARIRQNPDFGQPKMIMLSSAGHRDAAERCRQLDVEQYLLKPIVHSELLDAVMDAVGVRASEQSPEVETRGASQLKILLAEDGLVNQRVAVGLLETRGHRVVVANNGVEAVAAFDSDTFDVVLMDVQMPEMDGYQATAAIRQRERRSGGHTPIIAMTAAAMKGDREKCLAAGMDGYIAKPIDRHQLDQVLDELATKAATAAAPQAVFPNVGEDDDKDDVDLATALQCAGGDRTIARDLAVTLLEECPRLIADMRRGLEDGNLPQVERGALELFNAASVFAAQRVMAAAQRLEEHGRAGDLGQAERAFGQLQQEAARLTRSLEWVVDALSQ
jgi:CheY-like chemotaxis protein/HPt (histidine-containing phosphotransfer) domain-containing protein